MRTYSTDEVLDPHLNDPETALYYLMHFFEESSPDDQLEYAIKRIASVFGEQVNFDQPAIQQKISQLRTVQADHLTLEMMAELMELAGCKVDMWPSG